VTEDASYAAALRFAIHELNQGKRRAPEGVITAEAEQLLEAALGKKVGRMELYSRARESFPEKAWGELSRMVAERASGRPLQHVTGRQTFLEHVYDVTPDVLIPRPETEALVRRATQELGDGAPPSLGVEIGLGSGVISIELLAEFPGLEMIASEASPAASKVASRNAFRILGQASSRLLCIPVSDATRVCEPIAGALIGRRADFLISNPPYLAGETEVEVEVARHEPKLALYSSTGDPLHFYREIAGNAAALLTSSAPVFLEVPHERAKAIRDVFTSSGWNATIFADLTGRERILVARRAQS
jgi:release factor glutamine methyltransferase